MLDTSGTKKPSGTVLVNLENAVYDVRNTRKQKPKAGLHGFRLELIVDRL